MPDPTKQSPPPDEVDLQEEAHQEQAFRDAAVRAHEELDGMPEEGWPLRRLLPLIKAALGAVGKNRRMEEGRQRYLYRSMDDILDAAHLALVNAGVTPVPVAYSHLGPDGTERPGLLYTDFLSASGTKGVRITGTMTWRLLGPLDELDVPILVEANDYADKGTAKAYTVGLKTLMGQLFTIPFSMPDQDDDRPERMADQPRRQDSGSGGGNRQGQGNRPAQGRRDDRAGAAQRVSDAQRGQLRKAAERLSPEGQRLLKEWREAEGISTEPGKFLVPGWRRVMQKAGELEREGHRAQPGQAPPLSGSELPDDAEPGDTEPTVPARRGPSLPGAQVDRYAEEPEGEDMPDAELRDHFTDRIDAMGDAYAEVFQTVLDASETNPMVGADWRTQLAQLPPEWDEWLAEAVALVEGKHAEENPPDYDAEPEGRPFDAES